MKRKYIVLMAFWIVFATIPHSNIAARAEQAENIEFTFTEETGQHYDRDYLESKGVYPSRYGTGAKPYVIDSWEECDRVYIPIKTAVPEGEPEPSGTRNPYYYDEHISIIIYATAPTLCHEYDAEKVTFDGTTVVIYYSYGTPEDSAPSAVQENLLHISVKREDIEGYENIITVVSEKGGTAGRYACKGVIDGNGYVEAYDYIYLKRACMGTLKLDGEQTTRADVNLDGRIDKFDYILIKRIYTGTYTG